MTESAEDRKPRLPDEDEPANRALGDRLDEQGASAAGTPTNAEDSRDADEANGDSKPEEPNAKSFDDKVLDFARISLAGIAVLGLLGAVFFVVNGWENDEAAAEVFKFVKVGLLPLAVLILTHYFRKEGGADGGD